jgi:cytochrome c biogenesis protein CcmG/thiol:disulfide interchange protein DsbE
MVETAAGDKGNAPMMKSRWIAAAAAACAVALLVVPMMVKSAGRGELRATPHPVGTANLDLTMKDMHGANVSLADYKGKVIVLNFWATWCGPCQTEIPELVDISAAYKDQDVVVLGVSIDDTAETLREYGALKKMNYPSLLLTEEMDDAYGPIVGVPVTFFIGRDGQIARKHFGAVTKEQVEREIKALL